MNHFRENNRRK